MATEAQTLGRLFPQLDLETVRRRWGWYVAIGITLMVLGAAAIGWSVAVTVASVVVFGVVLLAAGVIRVLHAFTRKKWSNFFADLATGVLYFVAGFMLAANPAASALALTLVIAIFLIVGGTFRTVVALAMRYPSWGWVLLHGVVSLLLGIAIWQQWPLSGLWVIGLFVGIDMIFDGIALTMAGVAIKRISRTRTAAPPPGAEPAPVP